MKFTMRGALLVCLAALASALYVTPQGLDTPMELGPALIQLTGPLEVTHPAFIEWSSMYTYAGLAKRTLEGARAAQLRGIRTHVLRTLYRTTAAVARIAWPSYATRTAKEIITEELRHAGFNLTHTSGGLRVRMPPLKLFH